MTLAIEEARRYLQLADDDAAAFRGLLKLPEVKFRLACFHAQQAVGKLLKAVMVLHGIIYHRTHDLNTLAAQLLKHGITPPYFSRGIDKAQSLCRHLSLRRYGCSVDIGGGSRRNGKWYASVGG